MRCFALVLALAACGGAAKSASTLPANDAPEPFERSEGAPPAPPPEAPEQLCANHPDEMGPFLLTAQQASTRHGVGAKTFADAPSSKDQPIELCGVSTSYQRLVDTTCADGSRPFAAPYEAAKSRVGNVGPGGRCDAIIDHYVVKCPEAAYDVYIDMYMCGPDESF